jgi:thiosulfate reductase / polysulfide reductase chain A
MVSRRDILKAGAAAIPGARLFAASEARAEAPAAMRQGGEDYCHLSGTKRKAIPTVCGQCPANCAALGYVEHGRVVKIEGHPESMRTRGKLCARGQAGVNLVSDPDRVLRPLKRAGVRGEGKWTEISWDEALGELGARLARLRDEGRPERFLFHHGRISASARTLIELFLGSYGTGSIVDQSGLGQGAKRTALELSWGGRQDSWDFGKTRFILNFGSNCLEAGFNHLALMTRLAAALAERRARLVTIDVRLSNTAALSDQWVPIAPGTDLALVLAMCNVVMSDKLYLGEGEEFLRFCKVTPDASASTMEKIAALERHLADYTPEWAAGISGVDASTIRDLAVAFATTKPACVISARGAVAHDNGLETERAIQMLAAITGNIDRPGTRCPAVVPPWQAPGRPADGPAPKPPNTLGGLEGQTIVPGHGAAHQALKLIASGRAERPEVYMWYGHNPVYANGGIEANVAALKDETLIPYTVCVSPFYDESAALADLILPDATYLERWDWEAGWSPDQTAEFAIRQPLVAPRGKARDFKDVVCDLAERMGFPLGFESGKAFVAAACELTPEVRDNGGFTEIAKRGVLSPKNAVPAYYSYRKRVPGADLQRPGVILDAATGVYWDWTKSAARSEPEARRTGYSDTLRACAGYVGQRIGDAVYSGFKPGAVNKSGYFEIYSAIAAAHDLGPLPGYRAIPEHQAKRAEELVLTTHKVAVQAQSTSQNCKWLTELYYENPAWIHPGDAAVRGIGHGDRIRIESRIGAIETVAKVTNLIAPGVVAVSGHGGHWEYGRYASGKSAPFAAEEVPDEEFKWWRSNGAHPNWIIPSSVEPRSGQQRWMDTVVTVIRV